ncbi:hypothetical protein ACN38_g13003 [Penicillium nordicum]|uniref:Uncharacterized protein n=1 Tax=Penicillium nordicum TaxID=229535 RepID=A0A0M9W9R6_9EURO|nr:hypothetical protein ACN38_g13003 [Penicillium nordicum]
MEGAVVGVAVLSVAAAAESVASETADGEAAEGGEAASGEIPGREARSGAAEREAADAEEETADGCCRGSNSRKVVTLVPTRRRRKRESNSLMVKNLVNGWFERGMMIEKRSDKTEGIRNRIRWIKEGIPRIIDKHQKLLGAWVPQALIDPL